MIALALLVALAPPAPAAPPSAPWTLDEVLAAVRTVESGGSPDGGRSARGDRGAALGPYQIHYAYWQDARVPGRYEDCAEAAYSRRVVLAYWSRWCPRALADVDAEVLARVHNGGPQGPGKPGTCRYWDRVEAALIEGRERRDVVAAGAGATLERR